MPFSFMWGTKEPIFIPVGTTFAAIGADMNGIMLKEVKKLNEKTEDDCVINSINPQILEIAFKEVEQVNLTKQGI